MRNSQLILLLLFCSCGNPVRQAADMPDRDTVDTVATALLDSLGELAYENYASYEKQPDLFLRPITGKRLSPSQQETYLWILANMAYGFQEHSRFLASTRYYEQALQYDNEQQILEPEDRLTYLYKPLANNYTILANYEKAEKLQLQAIAEAEAPATKASFYNNLALLYVFKGEDEKSRDAALAGLAHCPQTGYLNVLLHNSLSAAYVALGKLDSAKRHNETALRTADALPMDGHLASGKIAALERKARFLLGDGRTAAARERIAEAIAEEEAFFPTARFREKASLHNALGESHLREGERALARDCFLRAKKMLDDNIAPANTSSYTTIGILKNLALAHAGEDADTALHYFERAVEEDFTFQQNITGKADHLHNNLWNRQLLEDVYRAVGNVENAGQEKLIRLLWLTELTKGRLLWNDINRSAAWENASTALENAVNRLQQLYALRDKLTDAGEIAEANGEINALLSAFELEEQYFSRRPPLPDFDTFRAHLQDRQAVTYSYFIHADSSLSVFKVENGRTAYFRRKNRGLLDSVAAFKSRYFSGSPHAFNNRPRAYFRAAEHLCRILLPELPTGPTRLRLSLDNELHVLPFDALSRGDRSFLVEDVDVQYLHSLLVFDLYDAGTAERQKIAVFYRDEYEAPLADLHFVEKEVDNLRGNYRTEAYSYRELDEKKLAKALGKNSIVHIAAHTTLFEGQQARLMLHQPISADQLRYYQIRSPLVVLSACNTASGNLLPSEGLESINRAFLSKGVPGVIATHWFANDDAMLDLTALFYRNLAACGSPVRALAEAKRQYLAKQPDSGINPWYWANMAYTGTEGKISLK